MGYQSTIFAGLAAAIAMPLSVQAKTHYVPITYRVTSGVRPYFAVKLNGKPFLFMVHANASFTLQTTHANARAAGVTNLVHKGEYGIIATGVKSTLGRDAARLDRFDVGGFVSRDLPLSIFETPQNPPIEGMAGIGWIRQAKAFVDYNRNRLAIPATDADAARERRRLIASGYVAVPMEWDEASKRFYVHPELNGVAGKFTISTVAEIVIDIDFAKEAKVSVGPSTGTFGGPTGTTGDIRNTVRPYTLELAGQRLNAPVAVSYDTYAYEETPRLSASGAQICGDLGCDFMRANQAVIDFSSGTLFIRRKAAA